MVRSTLTVSFKKCQQVLIRQIRMYRAETIWRAGDDFQFCIPDDPNSAL